jgi:hypothetical protein
MSKLQLLYKKQLNILNENLIYERKKYLTMNKGENSTNAGISNVNGKSSRVLQAAKKYRSLNKKVSLKIVFLVFYISLKY